MIKMTNTKKMLWILCLVSASSLSAQTVINGFFLKQNDFTLATSYSYKSFDNFYRSTTLTEANPMNMGEISSSIVSVYGEYGVLDWLSTTINLPYISMKNETGVLDPVSGTNEVEGIQDLGLFLKAKVIDKKFNNASKIAIGGAARCYRTYWWI